MIAVEGMRGGLGRLGGLGEKAESNKTKIKHEKINICRDVDPDRNNYN